MPPTALSLAVNVLLVLAVASSILHLAATPLAHQLLNARAGACAVQVGSYTLFAGGMNGTTGVGPTNGISDVVDMFNSATNTWSTARLQEPRTGLICCATNGFAIFVAGSAPHAGYSVKADIFNSANGQWLRVTDTGAAVHYVIASGTGPTGRYAVLADEGGNTYLYDTQKNTFAPTYAQWPGFWRANPCAAYTQYGVLFAGGGNELGAYQEIDLLLLDAKTVTKQTYQLTQGRYKAFAATLYPRAFFIGGVISNGVRTPLVVEIYTTTKGGTITAGPIAPVAMDTDTWVMAVTPPFIIFAPNTLAQADASTSYIFNTDTLTWGVGPAVPAMQGRSMAAVTSGHNTVFLVGGMTDATTYSSRIDALSAVFVTASSIWYTGANPSGTCIAGESVASLKVGFNTSVILSAGDSVVYSLPGFVNLNSTIHNPVVMPAATVMATPYPANRFTTVVWDQTASTLTLNVKSSLGTKGMLIPLHFNPAWLLRFPTAGLAANDVSQTMWITTSGGGASFPSPIAQSSQVGTGDIVLSSLVYFGVSGQINYIGTSCIQVELKFMSTSDLNAGDTFTLLLSGWFAPSVASVDITGQPVPVSPVTLGPCPIASCVVFTFPVVGTIPGLALITLTLGNFGNTGTSGGALFFPSAGADANDPAITVSITAGSHSKVSTPPISVITSPALRSARVGQSSLAFTNFIAGQTTGQMTVSFQFPGDLDIGSVATVCLPGFTTSDGRVSTAPTTIGAPFFGLFSNATFTPVTSCFTLPVVTRLVGRSTNPLIKIQINAVLGLIIPITGMQANSPGVTIAINGTSGIAVATAIMSSPSVTPIISCPAGTTPQGLSLCVNCSAGAYNNPKLTGTSCLDCNPGQYALNPGSTACTDCVAGRYGPSTGASSLSACIECTPGRYGPSPAASSFSACTECTSGRYSSSTGASSSSTCIECVAGRYGPSTGASSLSACIACTAGRYGLDAAASSSFACTECTPGRYGPFEAANSSSACIECMPGRYGPPAGATSVSVCTECVVGTFNVLRGAAFAGQCVACPVFSTTRGNGSTSNEGCVCVKGFYTMGEIGAVDMCRTCEDHATCTDGKLTPEDGYWVDPAYSSSQREVELFECFPIAACVQGNCTTGYDDFLCASCAAGYVKGLSGGCLSCVGTAWLTVCLLYLPFSLAVIGYLLVTTSQPKAAVLSVALNYLQLLSQIRVPPESTVSNLLHAVQLNLSHFAGHTCTFDFSYKSAWFFTLFTPLWMIGLFFGAYGLYQLYNIKFGRAPPPHSERLDDNERGVNLLGADALAGADGAAAAAAPAPPVVQKVTPDSIPNTLFRTSVAIWLFTFMATLGAATLAFPCRSVGSRSVLYFNPAIECHSAAHNELITFAVLYLFVLAVVIPIFIGFGMNRAISAEAGGVARAGKTAFDFSFLTAIYRSGAQGWEGVLLMRRFLLVLAVQIFIATPNEQVMAMWIVVTISTLLHHKWLPYADAPVNEFETHALCVISLSYALQLVSNGDAAAGLLIALNSVFFGWCLIRYGVLRLLWNQVRAKCGDHCSSCECCDCCDRKPQPVDAAAGVDELASINH